MNARHIPIEALQAEAEKASKPEAIYIDTPRADGACFGVKYLIGLCPKCAQPIGFNFCNGGKCSPALTLHIEHLLTGQNRCERADYNKASEVARIAALAIQNT